MAGSRKRPGKFPDWLFDQVAAFPGRAMCLWLCSGCGAPYWFPQNGTKHGGPPDRLWKPSLAGLYVGPCYRSHAYGVKCVTPKGIRWLYHEGMPAVEQPDQPDLANIETIIATRGGRRPDKRVQKGGRQ